MTKARRPSSTSDGAPAFSYYTPGTGGFFSRSSRNSDAYQRTAENIGNYYDHLGYATSSAPSGREDEFAAGTDELELITVVSDGATLQSYAATVRALRRRDDQA